MKFIFWVNMPKSRSNMLANVDVCVSINPHNAHRIMFATQCLRHRNVTINRVRWDQSPEYFDTQPQFSHVTSSERRRQESAGSSRKRPHSRARVVASHPHHFTRKTVIYSHPTLRHFFFRKACATKIMSFLLFLMAIHTLTLFLISVYHFWHCGPSLIAQFSCHFWYAFQKAFNHRRFNCFLLFSSSFFRSWS